MMANFGVIGCGKIGTRHIDSLKKMDSVKIIGVADIIEERAKNAALSCNAKSFTDYLKLLKNPDIDIVNICVPSGLHAQMSIAALNAGKHVLCEKPMALSIKDADEMINTTRMTKKKLFIVKQNRFNAPIHLVRDIIGKRLFGKIYYIGSNIIWNRRPDYYTESDWRGTRELDGGPLFTQASHFVDIMLLLGGPVKSVFMKADRFLHNIETEDTGTLILKYDSGAFGNIFYTTCAYNANIEGSLTILGTKGSVKIGGEYLNKIEHWNVEGYPLPEKSDELAPPNDYSTYKGSSSKHDCVFREVIKSINGDQNADIVDALEGRKTVEIIQAAKLSSQTGKEIFLPLKNNENGK